MTNEQPKKRRAPKEKRVALRDELFARIDRNDIGLVDAIKIMRKVAGRSQVDYAKLVGVSPRVLIELERGIGNPTLQTLRKILAPFALDVGVRRRDR